MNDAFCDRCLKFKGHEDVFLAQTPVGKFLLCGECKEEIQSWTKEEQKDFFETVRKGKGTP